MMLSHRPIDGRRQQQVKGETTTKINRPKTAMERLLPEGKNPVLLRISGSHPKEEVKNGVYFAYIRIQGTVYCSVLKADGVSHVSSLFSCMPPNVPCKHGVRGVLWEKGRARLCSAS